MTGIINPVDIPAFPGHLYCQYQDDSAYIHRIIQRFYAKIKRVILSLIIMIASASLM